MNREVREYISKQKSPQKEILKKVRAVFFKALPHCDEKKAWGVVTFAQNRFYLAALKERVHVGFAISGLDKKELSFFEGGGKTMRHIKIRTQEDINEKRLIRLIRRVYKKCRCESC